MGWSCHLKPGCILAASFFHKQIIIVYIVLLYAHLLHFFRYLRSQWLIIIGHILREIHVTVHRYQILNHYSCLT